MPLLLSGFALFISGFNPDVSIDFFVTGFFVLIAGFFFFFNTRHWVTAHCPKCGCSTLELVRTEKRKTGQHKKTYSTVFVYENEIIETKKFYICTTCGHQEEQTTYDTE